MAVGPKREEAEEGEGGGLSSLIITHDLKNVICLENISK
jgi:hypothetical protein